MDDVNTILDTANIVVFDLETTDLKANFGHIMCAAAKRVGDEETYYWRIDDDPGYGKNPASFMDDSMLVESLVEYLSEADVLVAHYGSRFDVPFLNTRAKKWGLPVLPPIRVVDTWRTARNHMCLSSNRLSTLNELLNADTKKYSMPWDEMRLARFGDSKALDILVDYCVNDVVALEETYVNLRDLIRNHPYVGIHADLDDPNRQCPACASCNTQQRGNRRTKCFIIKRHHCQNCGHWYDGVRKKVR